MIDLINNIITSDAFNVIADYAFNILTNDVFITLIIKNVIPRIINYVKKIIKRT